MSYLKRITVPKSWRVLKKSSEWAPYPHSSGYALDDSVPLMTLIREYLKYADTSTEAKKIIRAKKILVDQKVRTDPHFAVGLMNVVSIPLLKKHFRVIYDNKGRLDLCEIPEQESSQKLCKIVGKKKNINGKIQLSFHDGRTMMLEKANEYKLGDSLLIEIPSQKIVRHIPLKIGSKALITGGHNKSKISTLKEIQDIKTRSSSTKMGVLVDENDEVIRTSKEYLFCVGEKNQEITVTAS